MAAAAYVVLRSSSRYPDFEKARENPLLYTVRPLGDVLRDPFGAVGPAWSAYRPAFAGYVTLPLFAAALAGAVLALRQHWGLALILLAWIFVPFTVAMLFSTAPFPRHVMYLLPPGIVLAAFALVEGVQLARRLMPRAAEPRWRAWWPACCCWRRRCGWISGYSPIPTPPATPAWTTCST